MMEKDEVLRRVCLAFREFPNEQCSLSDMPRICELANLPLYWKNPIFMSLTKGESRRVSLMDFTVWWRAMTSVAHDEAARFIYTLSHGTRSYLIREDLYGMVMDIMHTHPSLEICREAVDLYDKYCDVVIARIMWNLGCVWRGKITPSCLRKSDLLEKIRNLQENEDINSCVRYFSSEYWFRVLDEDGDGLISMYEMERFHQAVVSKLTERGIESNPFEDVLCQMLDMICPINETSIRLSDLKKSPLSVQFLNALVNWRKFYAQETTEGSQRVIDETGREVSDWERFCFEECETMLEKEEDFDENSSGYLDVDDPPITSA